MIKPESLGIFNPGTTWGQVVRPVALVATIGAVALGAIAAKYHSTHRTQNTAEDHPTKIERLAGDSSLAISDSDGIRAAQVYVQCSAADFALLSEYKSPSNNTPRGLTVYFGAPLPKDYVLRVNVEDANGTKSRRFL